MLGQGIDVRAYFHMSDVIIDIHSLFHRYAHKNSLAEKNIIWLLSEVLRSDPIPTEEKHIYLFLEVLTTTFF